MNSTTAANLLIQQKGDTAIMLINTSLSMIMIPGLAFFYSGMVHKKNMITAIA